MAFEKVKETAYDVWSSIVDWYDDNEDEIWTYTSWLIGSAIGGWISGKLGLFAGRIIGYNEGFSAGQKNAIGVMAEYNKKA